VAGETQLATTRRRDEVVRLYLTNTANTRVFNGVSRGRGEARRRPKATVTRREELVDAVMLAPSERAIGSDSSTGRGP